MRCITRAWMLSVVLIVASNLAVWAQTPSRPNFILLIADDMAWDDCGAYGHRTIKTPNLDKLSQQGMRFDCAFSTCSSCSPSRASTITGRYPHNTGAHQLHMPLPAEQITFPELLKAAGYWTVAAGKWHLGNPAKAKFDEVHEQVPRMLQVLKDRPRDKPFFCWFGFTDPHRPYESNAIAAPHQLRDVTVPPYLTDSFPTRGDLALYYDEISRMDGAIGQILEELDQQGVSQDTMVLFISDNGRPFPRCKTTLYDSGIKTPFLLRFPRLVQPGRYTSQLVSTIDIAPTILELAGVKKGASFQGESLVPLLKDPDKTIRKHIFAEHNWHDFDDHGRAVRSAQFKYIRNDYMDIPGTPPADAVRSPTYQMMIQLHEAGRLPQTQQGCFLVPRPAEELYDTQADPHELNNLAGDPQYAQSLASLKAVLVEWEQATGDRVPAQRTPDQFDRRTGERLPTRRS